MPVDYTLRFAVYLAEKVRHVSQLQGDGAGYDIESYSLDGTIKYVEVKTTKGSRFC